MRAKTHYDAQPEAVEYAQANGGTYVRFRENIRKIENAENPAWEADEYSVFIKADETSARARVEAKPALFLAAAKANAVKAQPLTVNDLADAVIELGEIIAELMEE